MAGAGDLSQSHAEQADTAERDVIHTATSSMILKTAAASSPLKAVDARFPPSRTKLVRSLSDQYNTPVTARKKSFNGPPLATSHARGQHASNSRSSAQFLRNNTDAVAAVRHITSFLRQNTAPVSTTVTAGRSSSFPELSKPQIARQSVNNDTDRQCWICYSQESDDPSDMREWVSPCKCHGTTQWVHQQCLTRWIDARQRGNIQAKVKCPQCNTIYRIKFKSLGTLTRMLDVVDVMIARTMPYAAGGVLLASVYWTATSYGAFTVLLFLGPSDAMRFIDERDSPTLLIALPTIPVFLVLLRTVEWHEMIFFALLKIHQGFSSVFSLAFDEILHRRQNVLRRRRSPIGVGRRSSGAPATQALPEQPTVPVGEEDENAPQQVLAHKHSSPSRTLCGALLMPVFATLTGRFFYKNVFPQSRWRQVLAGGATFLAAKAVVQILYRRRKLAQFKSRRVMDYSEAANNAAVSSNLSTPTQTNNDAGETEAEHYATASSMLVHDSDYEDEEMGSDLHAFVMGNDDGENDEDNSDEADDDGEEEQGEDSMHSGNHEYRLLVHIEL